ncbi:MAG: hypothetical protein AMXMBFR4_13430 [Candidatus Hydrogenedentota bacterium]
MIWWVIFFFMVGLLLVLVEFILPGLVCGIIGGAMIVASCVLALYSHPEHALVIILGEGLAVILSLIFGFYVLPRSPLGKAMLLEETLDRDAGWVSDPSDASLIGAMGEVFTPLRPAGTITVRGRRISAVSSGDFVEEGCAVRVVEVHGNRVVVEPAGKQ